MNKSVAGVFVIFIIVAVAKAADESEAFIIRYENDVNEDGTYKYEYETSNGINVQESGSNSYAAGSYHYTAPDGQPIQLEYTADENGFRPRGDHLPTPPPIPDYILRGLAYIEAHPFPRVQL